MTSNPEANRPSDSTEESLPRGEGLDQSAGEQGQVEPGQGEIEKLAAEIEKLKAELAEKHEMVLRAHADAENIRRRAQEDISKARKYALESFAESLVPVKDSLEAALAVEKQTLETMREGVETTLKQLVAAFERNHLKEIVPAAGEKFDPHQHQAIATIPSEHPSNTVVAVLQKGYLITDRVLRPALVTVSSGAPAGKTE